MDKKFLAIICVIILGFAGFIYFKQKNNTDNTSTVNLSEHTKGAGNKRVTLVEYGDYQCPVCGQYYQMLQAIESKYGDDITFQFRNFPLDAIHPNARAAHRAAEAAGMQGKYFEMYDLLYQNQSTWSASTNSSSIFESYATRLNLDLDKYRSDFLSEDVNNVINADAAEGQKLGVEGTPTFYLNGRKLSDDERASYDNLVKAIDAEIAKVTTSQN
ncbi:thioredoxin domain-containing protein [Candidatus Saccharibacteria bacterium]|nr:thioredoxin domain-containing protein [Candidatus Saccharibacteria bacterium]